jgi:hypothetical protein
LYLCAAYQKAIGNVLSKPAADGVLKGSTSQAAEKLHSIEIREGFVTVIHRRSRPMGNETEFGRFFVLLHLQSSFFLGHDFSRAACAGITRADTLQNRPGRWFTVCSVYEGM